MPHRAPGADWNPTWKLDIVDQEIGDVIGGSITAIVLFWLIGGGVPPALPGDVCCPVVPAYRAAMIVQHSPEPLQRCGSIEVMLYVVFPRPDDLDRSSSAPRQLHGLDNEVLIGAPAEASSEKRDVDRDVRFRQSSQLGGLLAGTARKLRGRPDIDSVAADVGGAVHRFHAGMRREGYCVDSFNETHTRRDGPPFALTHYHTCTVVRVDTSARGAPHLLRSKQGTAAMIPLDAECQPPLRGGPHGIRQDCNAARQERGDCAQLHNVSYTAYRTRTAILNPCDPTVEGRTSGDRSDQHAWQSHVDSETGMAGHLLRAIRARHVRADKPECPRILESHLGRIRYGNGRRLINQVAVSQPTPARHVDHFSVFGSTS